MHDSLGRVRLRVKEVYKREFRVVKLELCYSIWMHAIDSCRVHDSVGRGRLRVKQVHKREFRAVIEFLEAYDLKVVNCMIVWGG